MVIKASMATPSLEKFVQKAEKPIQVYPIIHQKAQIFHDTIYIANPNNPLDTLLIRVVKQTTPAKKP